MKWMTLTAAFMVCCAGINSADAGHKKDAHAGAGPAIDCCQPVADPCCPPPRRGLFDGLFGNKHCGGGLFGGMFDGGLFKSKHAGCCAPAPAPVHAAPAPVADCCPAPVDPCCPPRRGLFDGLFKSKGHCGGGLFGGGGGLFGGHKSACCGGF